SSSRKWPFFTSAVHLSSNPVLVNLGKALTVSPCFLACQSDVMRRSSSPTTLTDRRRCRKPSFSNSAFDFSYSFSAWKYPAFQTDDNPAWNEPDANQSPSLAWIESVCSERPMSG